MTENTLQCGTYMYDMYRSRNNKSNKRAKNREFSRNDVQNLSTFDENHKLTDPRNSKQKIHEKNQIEALCKQIARNQAQRKNYLKNTKGKKRLYKHRNKDNDNSKILVRKLGKPKQNKTQNKKTIGDISLKH